MKCSNCGFINEVTATTCAGCGRSLVGETSSLNVNSVGDSVNQINTSVVSEVTPVVPEVTPVETTSDALTSQSVNPVSDLFNQVNTPAASDVTQTEQAIPPVIETPQEIDQMPVSINQGTTPVVVNPEKEEKPKKKGKKLLILLIIVIILLLIYFVPKIIRFIDGKINTNEIKIVNLVSNSKSGDRLYVIDSKLNVLKGKIVTSKTVKEGHIKIYVGKLVIKDENINKKFTINDFDLALGLNNVEISYTVGDETIKSNYYLYNNSLDNLGSLDNSDDDKDGLANYLEEAFSTDKKSTDTDLDGLSDYDEIYVTSTNPTLYASYNNVCDGNADTDLDGLSNIDEIAYGSNPIIPDTDGDGLLDGLEKQNGSNYSLVDTDSDGLSDYDEVVNFKTSPLVKTTTISGNISNNSNVNLMVNNISTNDIGKVKVVEASYALLNENLDGYILPPYKIDTDIDINPTISFDLSSLNLGVGSVPTIYEIDSKTLEYKEVTSYNDGNTISALVDDTNNLYMLFDKNYLMSELNSVSVTDDVLSEIFANGDHYVSVASPLIHVVQHFFNIKDIPKESLKIYCFGECNNDYLSSLEKILDEEYEGLIDFEFKKSNKLGYFFVKKYFDFAHKIFTGVCDKEDDMCTTPDTVNSDSKILHFLTVATICDVIGSDDLGIAFLGSENLDKFRVTRDVDLTDSTDSNNDGISDSLMELVISGRITTKEGYNPFEGLTLEQINKNDDYDSDGLKNNEEISIEKIDGIYTLVMKSDPTKKDTDDDGILDSKDPYPMISFDSNYILRDSIKGEPSNLSGLINEVNVSNSLYGVGSVVPYNKDWYVKYEDLDGTIKYSPYSYEFQFSLMYLGAEGGHIYARDAAKAHDMFFNGNGRTFTENDATKEFRDDPSITYYFDKTIDDYIRLAKNTVSDGEKLIFENKHLMPGIDPAYTSDGSSQSMNVFGFLHYSSSDSIGEVSNDNGVYRIKLRYFIEDIYDWKNNAYELGFAGQVEVMYYNQVLLGHAKNFLVHIEYDAEIYYDSNTGEKRIEKFMTPIYN